MRVGIATDHGGFGLTEDLRGRLAAAGHDVVEFGAFKLDSGDDYPDFVLPLARAVAALSCGSDAICHGRDNINIRERRPRRQS